MDAISGEKLPLEKGVGIYTQALLAGNDLLLCNDYTTAYEEILQAVQDGIISRRPAESRRIPDSLLEMHIGTDVGFG